MEIYSLKLASEVALSGPMFFFRCLFAKNWYIIRMNCNFLVALKKIMAPSVVAD